MPDDQLTKLIKFAEKRLNYDPRTGDTKKPPKPKAKKEKDED